MVTYTVTTALDSGDDATIGASLATDTTDGGGLSLREAVHWINLASGSNKIEFDASLQDAVIRLQAGSLLLDDINSAGDLVEIDGGTLNITISGDTNGDDTNFAGTSLTDVLATRAAGNFSDNVRILEVRLGVEATVRGLNFTGGYADDSVSGASDDDQGGAIFSESELAIHDSTFRGNATYGPNGQGGAVMAERASGVYGSTFQDNFTFGGTQSNGGALAITGDLTLTQSFFGSNATLGANGLGGAVSVSSGDATVSYTGFYNNYTTGDFSRGGALSVTGNGALTLTYSQVFDNHTQGYSAGGGGIHLNDPTNTSTIENVTLSGNYTLGNRSRGGGIESAHDLEFLNAFIQQNTTAGSQSFGGGISASGNVLLTDSTVARNFTSGDQGRGGGVYGVVITLQNSGVYKNNTLNTNADGGGLFGNTVNVTNSQVYDNATTVGEGGGIFASNTVTLDDAQVYQNRTNGTNAEGGGIYTTVLVSNDSQIFDNATLGADSEGGGIFARNSVTLTNTALSGNATLANSSEGGGLYQLQGIGRLYNSTVSGNSTRGVSSDGGGIYTRTLLELTNTTIHGNSTAGDYASGAGIASRSSLLVQNSTITSNVISGGTSEGAGIYSTSSVAGAVAITNSIVSGNFAAYGIDDIRSVNAPVLSGGTVVGSTLQNGTTLVNAAVPASQLFAEITQLYVDLDADGIAETASGAVGGVLADNGGTVQTVAILPGRFADGTGVASALPPDSADLDGDADTGEDLPVDAIGADRIRFGALDIGAIEGREAASLTVTTLTDIVDDGDGLTSLREAIAYAEFLSGDHTVDFDASLANGTIRLTQGELSVANATDLLAIDGGDRNITITGDTNGDDTLSNGLTDAFANTNYSDNSRILYTQGGLSLTGLTLTGGFALNKDGGALDALGDLTLETTRIAGNLLRSDGTHSGGGVSVFESLQMLRSQVSDNLIYVYGGLGSHLGGGIRAGNGGTIVSSTISGNAIVNDTDGSAGGISAGGDLRLINTTVANNASYEVGGIEVDVGNLLIENSTISGNVAAAFGGVGGVYLNAVNGDLTITNSIVWGNDAQGPSEFAGSQNGAVTLNSSIVNNTFGAGALNDLIFAQNLFNTVTAVLLDSNYDGVPDTPTGRYTGVLTPGDGFVDVMAIASGGFAARAGNDNLLPEDLFDLDGDGITVTDNTVFPPVAGEALPLDANEGARDQFGTGFFGNFLPGLDIGAVEAREAPGTVVTTALDVVDDTDGLTSLREAIIATNAGNNQELVPVSVGPGVTIPQFVTNPITFHASLDGQTIRLTQGQIEILGDATIDGTGVDVTISGDRSGDDVLDASGFTDIEMSGDALLADNTRIFDARSDLVLRELVLTGGSTTIDGQNGGAVRVDGNLTLASVGISGNRTAGTYSNGGAVYASGTLNVQGAALAGNVTQGLGADGGAIATAGDVTGFLLYLFDNKTVGDYSQGGGLATSANATLFNTRAERNVTEGYDSDGGGVAADGTLGLYSSIVRDNETRGDQSNGGGAFGGGSTIVSTSQITGNATAGTNADGGGLYARGSLSTSNALFQGNRTEGDQAQGGALFLNGGETATLIDMTAFNANSTAGSQADGGAIEVRGDVTIRDSSLLDNSTTGSFANGGGLNTYVGSTLILEDTLVQRSRAAAYGSDGGGLSINGNASLLRVSVLDNSTEGDGGAGGGVAVIGNVANVIGANVTIAGNSTSGSKGAGGGLFVDGSISGSVDLVNATIANNAVAGDQSEGAGVRVASGSLILEQATVAGNVAHGDAGAGGGIFIGENNPFTASTASLTLTNSIVTANLRGGLASGDYFADDLRGALTGSLSLAGNNIVGTTRQTNTIDTFSDASDVFRTTTEITVDADGDGIRETGTGVLTGELLNNGGAVQTLALKTGGYAFNAGDFTSVRPDDFDLDNDGNTVEPLSRDANGTARVYNTNIDLGAVEGLAEDPSLVVTTLADSVDAFDGLTSLREAVAFANAQAGADTITFDAGLDGSGNEILRLTQASEISITENLTIDGAGLDLIISGDRAGNDTKLALPLSPFPTDFTNIDVSRNFGQLSDNGRIFYSSFSLALKNLALTGGYVGAINQVGGAALAYVGLDLENVDLIGNGTGGANGAGGAIASVGEIVLKNVSASDNRTFGPDASGGVVFADTVIATNSLFEDNETSGGQAHGGAVYAQRTALLYNTTLTRNAVLGADADGGAVATDATGTATLTNVTITESRASGSYARGGGVYSGFVYALSSTITSNSTGGYQSRGGGIIAADTATLTNAIVAGNASANPLFGDVDAGTLNLQGGNVIGGGSSTPATVFDGSVPLVTISLADVFQQTATVFLDTDADGIGDVDSQISGGVLERTPFIGTLALPSGGVPVVSLVQGGPAVDAGDATLRPGDVRDLDGDGDTVELLPIDTLGTDRVLGADIDLGAEEAPQIDGTAGDDSVTGTDGNDVINGLDGEDLIRGGLGNDSIDGGADPDALNGGPGNDTIEGGPGDDLILGEDGSDVIYGGPDDDLILPGPGPDSVFGGGGTDTVSYITSGAVTVDLATPANNAGDAAGSTFDSVENLVGSASASNTLTGDTGNNELTGGASDDLLAGGAGNDTLTGNGGLDSLIGGAGNDTIFVDSADDVVVELANEGWDRMFSSVSIVAPDHVEGLNLQGTGDLSGTAATTGTWVIGTAGSNTVTGQQGNDRLDGAAGTDTLDGALGNDVLEGGADADIFVLSEGLDLILDFEDGIDLIDLTGAGIRFSDLTAVQAGANVQLGHADGLLTINNILLADLSDADFLQPAASAPPVITGTAGNDNLTQPSGPLEIQGLAGDDLLRVFTGSATLVGGADDDTYYVYDPNTMIIEVANEGYDRVYTRVDLVLSDNLEFGASNGTGDIDITGNALANQLVGNGDGNDLSGLAGNDRLNGRAGADTLDGGEGNDILEGGADADRFVFEIGDGTDVIRDFEIGTDLIDYSNAGLTFGDLMIVDNGGDALILQGTDVIRVENIAAAQLDAAQFDFLP